MNRLTMILKEILSTLLMFVVMFAIIMGVYRYVAEPFIVDGGSMEHTLESGERLWMLKLNDIERFDVIIFPAPSDPEKLYVKRVIGMPGDSIELRNDLLYLNGVPVEEPYLAEKSGEYDGVFTYDFTLEEITGETIVPEGKLFVMGDNRRNSLDGRRFGFIDAADVHGEADFIYWPLADLGLLEKYEFDTANEAIVER